MSGGSQHNPNGRQSQLGPGWSPLQVANFLARAPQVHMAAERGVTWHTPTPPPHLYHVPAPSPPDPLQEMFATLQAMKNAGGNSVFRHTATPPELYRHTPTPPDKHLMRHTPSPGDVKSGASMPQPELYPHLGPGRDKLVRPEDLLAYARVGVDLSLAGARAANGSPAPHPASPALSVRDAPTINSLIARAAPRHGHARVDALLERLAPAPASPHSVIVHPRAAPTPSPPSSNEVSAREGSTLASSQLERLAPAPASPHSVIVHPRAAPTPSPPSSNEVSDREGSTLASSQLERLAPAPASPHSVIVHPRAAPTPSPPSSNEVSDREGSTLASSQLERLAPAPASPHSVIVHPRAAPTPSPPSSNETIDALLERLAPAPASPHSVIVHPRAAPTPSPPSSNEDSADSCGAPPGSKRKRKPERTIRVPAAPAPAAPSPPPPRLAPPTPTPEPPSLPAPPPAVEPPRPPEPPKPTENGEIKTNGPERPPSPPPPPQQPARPPARRKTRSGSAETIDDIAAMIASTDRPPIDPVIPPVSTEPPVTVDNLKSVLASPEPKLEPEIRQSPPQIEEKPPEAPPVEAAAAPRRRNARTSNSESANVPVESPSEAKPAEPEPDAPTAEPTAASFVEVENQLEKMFAGIEEPSADKADDGKPQTAKAKKRRKSAPTKGERKASRRASRMSTDEGGFRRKAARKKEAGKKKDNNKDAYDSGSNASSGRSRGPYIQIRGPRDSPLSVSVINASTGEEEEATLGRRKGGEEFRNGLRARGLHASTLGLRYDATTPDVTWLCVFCERGPHAAGLGDLFGPYTVETDCEEYR
ncbi:basic proline-rich protein-like [Ostrinia nubilalis]|uniref:basic proline-rich protein-like n=1 Tax=Ostrinia nubilalis TaxID=29057 RepID=UPI003082671B